jgi:HEAT repeat protein
LFETLDSIDWASLDGCYRSAAEMPELLRSFLSPVEEIREWAIDEISRAVFHCGTVYSASPVVIPFLFELLENEEVQDREQVVCLLTAMAGCLVYEETNEEYRRLADAEARKEFGITDEESLQLARELVRAVKSEIAKRFDLIYLYLRSSDDFFVRLSVAAALGEFPDIAKRLRPDLERALRSEKDEHVRNAIKAAMGTE